MELNLLKTENLNIKTAIVKTYKGYYPLGISFHKDQSYDTKYYFFSISLIFWQIVLDIRKIKQVDTIYI